MWANIRARSRVSDAHQDATEHSEADKQGNVKGVRGEAGAVLTSWHHTALLVPVLWVHSLRCLSSQDRPVLLMARHSAHGLVRSNVLLRSKPADGSSAKCVPCTRHMPLVSWQDALRLDEVWVCTLGRVLHHRLWRLRRLNRLKIRKLGGTSLHLLLSHEALLEHHLGDRHPKANRTNFSLWGSRCSCLTQKEKTGQEPKGLLPWSMVSGTDEASQRARRQYRYSL